MTYAKLAEPVAGIDATLTAVLAQASIVEPVHDALLSAGSCVRLETGDVVWVSCVVHDRPETPQIDFITVSVACKSDAPWIKANGQAVASVFWSGLWPDALAGLGIDTVRKALMMVALGEPQPQVAIPSPAAGGPTTQDAIPGINGDSRSVRGAITAATETSTPVADVL